MHEIEAICNQMRDAEWSRNIDYMQSILSDDLVFRRANGTFADKKNYLDGLKDPNNTYDLLETVSTKVDVNEAGNTGTATVVLHAAGKRGKSQVPFNGTFRNIRIFRKRSQWELYAWFNESMTNHLIIHVPKSADSISYADAGNINFCGHVLMESDSKLPVSPAPRAVYVKFEKGARTKWHQHTMMQILLIKEGLGFVQQKGYASFDVAPGDRIFIPEHTWHIHGAKPGNDMEHLAFTLGETIWDTEDDCV